MQFICTESVQMQVSMAVLSLLAIMTALPSREYPIAGQVSLSLSLAAAALAAGLCWLSAERSLDERLAFSSQKQTLIAEVKITDIERKPFYRVLYAKVLAVQPVEADHQHMPEFVNDDRPEPALSHIRITTGHEANFQVGETWRMPLKVKAPVGSLSWHSFDYERWLITKDIDALASLSKKPKPEGVLKRLKPADKTLSQTWRNYWQQTLDLNRLAEHQETEQQPVRAILYALLSADRQFLTDRQWQVFRDTGTSHLMAISGMHIGFLALLMVLLVKGLGWFIVPLAQLRWQLLAAFAVCTVYAALTGWQVPVQRALLMLMVAYVVLAMGWNLQPSTILLSIACLIVAINPLVLLSLGFWLSFSAVGLILLVVTHRRRYPNDVCFDQVTAWQRVLRGLRAAFILQLVLSVGLLPLTLLFFGVLPSTAFFANSIAIPWVAIIIMPLLFILVLLALVSWQRGFDAILSLLEWLMQVLMSLLNGLSDLGLSMSFSIDFSTSLALMFCLFLAWLIRSWPVRALCLALALGVLLFPYNSTLKMAEFEVTALDIGKGFAAVIETQNHQLVYDLGEKWGSSSATERMVLPYLQGRRLNPIDALVISHRDNDHLGDLPLFLQQIQVNTLYSGSTLAEEDLGIKGAKIGGQTEGQTVDEQSSETVGIPVTACDQSANFHWDGVDFIWLSAPLADDKLNNESCVLLLRSAYGSVLLPGDIHKNQEQQLITHFYELAPVDVLFVAHHGSKTSSSQAFIDWMQPQLAISSANLFNPYGHPAKPVVERFEKRGIEHWQTGRTGSIRLRFAQEGLETRHYRDDYPHWWRLSVDRLRQ